MTIAPAGSGIAARTLVTFLAARRMNGILTSPLTAVGGNVHSSFLLGAGVTLSVKSLSTTERFASEASRVKVNVPVVVGVPVMVRSAWRKPAGRLPLTSRTLYGRVPLVKLMSWRYSSPAVAAGRLAVRKRSTSAPGVVVWVPQPARVTTSTAARPPRKFESVMRSL